MSPDTRRGPALDRPDLQNPDTDAEWFDADGTAEGARMSPTVDRSHLATTAFSRRLDLHREPAIAAALLIEELGLLGARRWLQRTLDEVAGA